MNTKLLKRARCAMKGHDWKPGTPLHGHDWCRRCERYDDAPGMDVGRNRWFRLRMWSPLWVTGDRRNLSVRVGWAYRPITAHVSFRLHWGWDRTGEVPGANVALEVWRVRLAAGIGSGWQDEDGEDRGLLYVTGRFKTYGLRWIGCWLGHKPSRMIGSDYVYCDRCDETLQVADRSAVAT